MLLADSDCVYIISILGDSGTLDPLHFDKEALIARRRICRQSLPRGFSHPRGMSLCEQTGITIYLENDGQLEHAAADGRT
jgi:hypothetical protein